MHTCMDIDLNEHNNKYYYRDQCTLLTPSYFSVSYLLNMYTNNTMQLWPKPLK